TGTSLASYTSALSCTGVTATGTTSGSFTMPDNDVTCTFTNTRLTNTVTLIKTLVPSNDPGLFNLLVNGVAVASNVGNNGTGSNNSVPVGSTVSVSETAGSGTTLTNYTAALSC